MDTETGDKKSQEVFDGKAQAYTAEFKREAVRLLEGSEKPSSEVARELGVRRNQLYKSKDRLIKRGGSTFPDPGRSQPTDELTRLRQDLERVKEERDILKKAAAYFAKKFKRSTPLSGLINKSFPSTVWAPDRINSQRTC